VEEKSAQKKPQGFRYKPQFGIVVVCSDQKDQEQKYKDLLKRNWKLKVVVV
jgi:hypothetical protein